MANIFSSVVGSPLRNKFILFFTIIASLPLLVLGGMSLYLMDISHRQDVSSLELQLIDQKIEEVQKFFADTLGILELRVGFAQKSEIELSQQKFLLEGLLEENKAFEEVSFFNLQGEETAKKLRQGFEDLYDLSKLPKFKIPLRGEDFIGEVYHTLSGPMVTLAAPVRNRNGDIIQVLSAEVSLLPLVRSVSAAKLGTSGYVVVVDRNGSLIASRQSGIVSPGADLSPVERVGRVLSGETLDTLDYRDRYQSPLTSLAVVGAGKNIVDIGWGILAEWPLEDADAPLRAVRNQAIIITILSLLGVFLFVPIFANHLIKPISDLKNGAAEIEEGNFEARVEIKTKDELEELGLAFNKMATGLKRLQELKNEFVFIAAHELRTPMTAIKGYLSMVKDDASLMTEKLGKYIDPVYSANERLIQLVNDILEIARSEAGRLKVEVARVELSEAVEAILQEVKPLASQKHISLSYEKGKVPPVKADLGRLKEIIMNFVSNAIKYNNEGGFVKIYHEIEKDKVITHVEDNGFGMSVEDQKHMFEKFFRSDTGKVKEIQGTGLGLFITKELIEKMDGKVWVRSEEDKGTRFSFSLPVFPVVL